jgi:hypothetical protein
MKPDLNSKPSEDTVKKKKKFLERVFGKKNTK